MNMIVTDGKVAAPRVQQRPLVRIVIVGHVDHGKSTLIGRLLHETGSLPAGKLENISAVSDRRGMPFEWSFLLDALQTERDQGITLDTSQIRFRAAARDIVLIDAPGHAEFVRNMVTGAAQADAALLVVDASEGVRDQTRRHIHLLHLLGVSQLAVVVNKMDRVAFDRARFAEIEAEVVAQLSTLGLSASAIIPISARHGDGVAQRTPSLAWHDGPTVLQMLDRFAPAKPLADLPLRIPVQAVYKFDDRRIIAGRVESGRLAVGDEIALLPRGTRARVQSIEVWPAPRDAGAEATALAGRSIGLTLDRQIFVERGDLIAAPAAPAAVLSRLRARIFWLHEDPLRAGMTVGVRVGMAERSGRIEKIEDAIDPGELSPSAKSAIARNHIGEIEIELSQPIGADIHAENPRTGRLVLDYGGRIAGGGLILADAASGRRSVELNTPAVRLRDLLMPLPAPERLARFRREVAGRLVFTTSFGLEDQAILHMLSEQKIEAEVVTLDTGRLFPETYALWAETERRYGLRIRAVYPRHETLESLIDQYGINGFYKSRPARAACCEVRKVEPLKRALADAAGWIVGLRADQSGSRQGTALVAADDRGLLKFSPLFDWTREAVRSYVAAHQIPVNPLHERGFVSIGCAPCTRAIAPGEPERAGRWWWERDEKKECGLHSSRRASLA
ncbi:MAG: phosphoadenylyl-sulfate reductase [Xanthobacteraceae bacterium]